MPTTNPSPYLPTTSARYHSLTSLNPLSPQKTSHEGHSPTTPVNKFARSQVKLLENRISQLIQMVEDDTASAEEAAKPINGGGQKKASHNQSKFRRLLGWKPFKRFRKLRSLRREKYSMMA